MKILLISGSQNPTGASAEAISFAEAVILRSGAEAIKYTAQKTTTACIGCGYCKRNENCVFSDLTELYEKLQISDALMVFAPTHYLGASPALTATLSRLFMSRMDLVKGKPAAAVAVGRRSGCASAIFDILRFFTFSASPIANGVYPAIYYGKGDAEGGESIELLTESLIFLIKSLTKAKEHGIEAPQLIRKCKTDLRSSSSER
jgi:multimeric flavodoxin WrbA